jgi:hypothetical protein
VAKAKQDAADMAAETHTILIAGGSGLVGHAAINAIAAGILSLRSCVAAAAFPSRAEDHRS